MKKPLKSGAARWMNDPVVFGLSAALSWGIADFIARFTGRALGHQIALFGMLGASAVIFTAIMWQSGALPSREPGGWWLLLGSGVGLMAATLLSLHYHEICLSKVRQGNYAAEQA